MIDSSGFFQPLFDGCSVTEYHSLKGCERWKLLYLFVSLHKKGRKYTMPKIDLYLLQKPEETQFYDYLPSIESWLRAYKQLHGESLVIHSSVLTESILPFITHPLVLELLEQEDLACLPLVFAENNLYCKGVFLRSPNGKNWHTLVFRFRN